MTVRMGVDAARAAHALVGKAEYHLMCKMFVGSAVFAADPSTSPTAIAAWRQAAHQHPQADPEKYPAYVPAFLNTSNAAEHVVFTIRRDTQGHRLAISTDAGPGGTIAVVRLAHLSAAWNAPMIGWTEDINAQRVWTPPAPLPVVHLADIIDAAQSNHGGHRDEGRIVERALSLEGLLDAKWVDGWFGARSVTAYAGWQRRLGYTGASANGIPGRDSLTRLGQRHGFRVN